MPATEPEQLHRLFEQAFNAGDLEALMELYEPDAALIPQPGVTVEGSDGIRDALRWFLDRQGQISLDTKLVVARRGPRLPLKPVVADRWDDARREPGGTRGHHCRGGSPTRRRHLALRDRQRLG